MHSEPSDQSQRDATLRTADELFARPECTHIITVDNSNPNVHLERVDERFRLLVGPPQEGIAYREFASLDELYEVMGREIRSPGFSLRAAIWQDISDYPAFTSPCSVRYRLLDGPVEVQEMPDNEHITSDGPPVVYGLASISSSGPHGYLVTPDGSWMVVEHPGFTFRGRVGRGILRPTHTRWERWKLSFENWRLRHDRRERTHVRPRVTVVYGRPPADWQSFRQAITAERPMSP